MDDRLRAWSNGESKVGYLAMTDVTEKPISAAWLYVKNRSEKTYENDKPDERIDRLQKLQDLSLVYIDGDEVNPADEIIEQGYNFGRRTDGDSPVEIAGGINISLPNPKEGVVEDHAKSRDPEDLKSNWHRLGSLGFFMTGYEDNNSQYPNVYKLSATSLHEGRIRIKNGSAQDTIQTIAQSRWLYVKNKTARTTTYQPTTPYGASRLEALNELKNVKDHYFDRSQLKTGCVENNINNPMQIGNWEVGMPTEDSNLFMKFVKISGGTGKLLGTYAYEIAPATNTTNHIYANVYANYLARTGASGTTEKRKQLRLAIIGGNESWASENGHSASLSTVRSCFCYIGTGEATGE